MKKNVRIISRFDIKGRNLIKGIHLEGFRVVGDPKTIAYQYYLDGIDEILFMDCVASLYGRNNLNELITTVSEELFVPVAVGGGVRNLKDAEMLLRAGADKIAINTAAIKNPSLISEIAKKFGSQCVALSIEAKKTDNNYWEAYTNNGREHTGIEVSKWAKEAENLGAGELLITSIDREGTRKGFDCDLISMISKSINIPIIASGGMGKLEDLKLVAEIDRVSAIAIADVLHYSRLTISEIKNFLILNGYEVRHCG